MPPDRSQAAQRWRGTALVWPALFLVLFAAACAELPSQATPGILTPTSADSPAGRAPGDREAEQSPTPPANGSTQDASAVMTLTIWTTVWFSPTQAITTGQILAGEVAAFEAGHPRVRLRFVPKEPYGEGGLLDFLLTVGPVVPDLLPDLILLDVDEVGTAAQTGRLQAIDALIPADLVGDLYPFGREVATVDGRLYGLQFQADLDHLVYDTGRIAVPPSSWPGVLSGPGPYLFPAGGKTGLANDALLIQYLAVRDQTGASEAGEPFLDLNSVSIVLQFYYDALSRGILPAKVAGHHSTDDSWSDYLAGQAALVQVSAHRYLQDRHRLSNSAVAPIPAMHGPASPIAHGWVLALVTAEPARQAAAVDFMVRMMSPATNAAWNQAAGYLPTRRAAMAEWQANDGYARFIDQQLQEAVPRPVLPNYAQTMATLQDAVTAVLSGSATPQQAATEALTPR